MEENWKKKHLFFRLKKKWRKWRAKRLSYPGGTFRGFIGKICFEFQDTPRHRKFFDGTYAFSVQESIQKFLPKGGVFIDVGANFGFISAVAANIIGPGGSVHCFEPVPEYFAALKRLKELNPSYTFFLNNTALGDFSGSTKQIYIHRTNPGGSSMLEGFIDPDKIQAKIEVPSERLDSYLNRNKVSPSMIKIDTEGYEWAVLRGCSDYFEKNRSALPPILVEVSRRGMELFGISPSEFESYMFSFGYKPYCVFGRHRMNLADISSMDDVLFLA